MTESYLKFKLIEFLSRLFYGVWRLFIILYISGILGHSFFFFLEPFMDEEKFQNSYEPGRGISYFMRFHFRIP